jgi:hypothetical protein
MSAVPAYPVRIEGELDSSLSRWLWLVKRILALPHYMVLAVRVRVVDDQRLPAIGTGVGISLLVLSWITGSRLLRWLGTFNLVVNVIALARAIQVARTQPASMRRQQCLMDEVDDPGSVACARVLAVFGQRLAPYGLSALRPAPEGQPRHRLHVRERAS